MTRVNVILTRTFDLLLYPFRGVPALATLSFIACITAIILLLVVRATSNQRALAHVKRQIHADLFEIRLLRDDVRAVARAQCEILRHNAIYLRLALVPMLWTLVPLLVVMAQLQSYFAYAALQVGQPVSVTAQWRPSERPAIPIEPQAMILDVSPGLTVETPVVWFPALQQAVWRVVAHTAGDHQLRVRIGSETYTKTMYVSDAFVRRSPARFGARFPNQLLYPSETPLPPSGPLASIRVDYPERYFEVFGRQFGWMSVYLAESMIFALLLKKPLDVSI